MSLSRPEIELLVEEITTSVCPAGDYPAGVQKVYQKDERTFVLQLRTHGQTYLLLLDANAGTTRLHFVDSKPRQPPEPSSFVMLLRKHLVGMALGSVELSEGDRIVRLDFERAGDDGLERRSLVVELTGRHGNAFLLADDGRILGMLSRSGGTRSLRPGGTWVPPPAPPSLDDEVRWDLTMVRAGARSAIVAAQYAEAVAQSSAADVRAELGRELRAERKRLKRLQKNVEADLARAEEARDYRRRGELLQSAYGQDVPRGAESVAVPDYYQPDTPLVAIPLDPARSLRENIERYFHEYRRLNDARGRIEDRLLETLERMDAVEAAIARLDAVDDEGLEDLGAELRANRLVRARAPQRARTADAPRLPYRSFRTRSGAAILVGRGAKQNDILTTRVARGRDVWLHARDWAGSHVVLRMDRDDPPDGEDLLDAATLAAWFSKGRADTLVDVTHTRAKHVRKPKGAAAGLVTVAGGSTIAVSLEDSPRLERLLESEESQ